MNHPGHHLTSADSHMTASDGHMTGPDGHITAPSPNSDNVVEAELSLGLVEEKVSLREKTPPIEKLPVAKGLEVYASASN